ncbi:cytochrome c biogenesis CcdA family protein [Bacillus testis]|uniref:cytochrome c biogenesis CcdA family protein n=1 Tax=Bacillus testis TaxID=1622072 RepID=UPI00067EDE85|nr:cytochrome c biogenesis protein CcdA [Bacillus testis]
MAGLNLFWAFGAGFLSFVSPCSLPIYPAFLSYITGMSVAELKSDNAMLKRRSILHTLFFLVGFSFVFILLGFGTSFIGHFLRSYENVIRQIGGILIVFFGLVIIGVFQPKFMMKEHKLSFKNRPSGYFGTVLIGLAFSLGWTPCTGPILTSVLAMAVDNSEDAIIYMVAYVLGFAIPFFILSFFIGRMKWIKKHNVKIVKIGGYIMIIMGIFLYFDMMNYISSFFVNKIFNGWKGF